MSEILSLENIYFYKDKGKKEEFDSYFIEI